jgi:hypothetical protein
VSRLAGVLLLLGNGGCEAPPGTDPAVNMTPDASAQADRQPAEPSELSCASPGKSCTDSSGCCAGEFCIEGRCGQCPDDSQYCPQLGGGCWLPDTVCETVKKCGEEFWGCGHADLTYDCATRECNCPDDYPVWCVASGQFPGECWGDGADCSTRVSCDGANYACETGYIMNCATMTCRLAPPPPPPPPPPVPTWLVGRYSRTGKRENNTTFTGDNRSIVFNEDGTYSHSLGSSSTSSGKFSVQGDTITFKTGSLTGTTLRFGTSFDSTCRILYGFDGPLWRSSEVPTCPRLDRVDPSECGVVGTFTKQTASGEIGSSGSGSETETTTTVRLFRDHFYTYDFSTLRRTCFASNCKSLSSAIQTVVGSWSQSGGAPPFSMGTLRTWPFSKSTAACPGP